MTRPGRAAAAVAIGVTASLVGNQPADGQSIVFERAIAAPAPFITAEWGYAVRPTSDGGLVAAGFTATALFPLIDDMWLVKTNAFGDTLWTRTYGGEHDDGARDVLETTDGGFAVLGSTQSFGTGSADVFLVRTDAAGMPMWSRTYGGPLIDTGNAMCAMPGGGWVLVGESSLASDDEIYAVRVDDAGDIIWERRYGGGGWQGAAGVCPRAEGGVLIAGYTATTGLFDLFLLAVDADGDSLWSRTYGGPDEDWASDVTPTQDGGYFVTGTTGAFFAAGFSGQAWALRVDSRGDSLWTRAFGVPGDTDAQANGGQQTADGGYVLAGSRIAPGGDLDVFVARLNATGHEIWSRGYDRGGETNHGASVRQMPDGAFAVVGYTYDIASWYDVYLAKIQDDPPTAATTDPGRARIARVHPNPFADTAILAIEPIPGLRRWQLTLYDVAGRRVRQQEIRDTWQVRLDRRDLATGTYFYRIDAGAQAPIRGKLTVRE